MRLRLQYDQANLERAYTACKGGMSVYKAAMIYWIILRDRATDKISLDARVGYTTIFTPDVEKALVDHIKYKGDIGYGYNKVGIQSLERDHAVSQGKSFKGKDSGSLIS